MKLCKDCKWRQDIYCRAPQNMKSVSPVDGEVSAIWLECCISHRTGGFTSWLGCRMNGLCGKEGRWFEAKTQSAASGANVEVRHGGTAAPDLK